MVRFIFSLVLIPIFCSCQNSKNEPLRDLPIEILNTDTTFLEVGFIQAVSGKFRLTPTGKILMIHQGVRVFWFDMIEKRIFNSLDLDTTTIMPETSLLSVEFQEEHSLLSMFFPAKKTVLEIDTNLNIISELKVESPDIIDHQFTPYGNVFYRNPIDSSLFIGLMSSLGITVNAEEFLSENKFVGNFNKIGELNNAFGGFSDERIDNPIHALSEGIFTLDLYQGKIYIRESIASNTIHVFDLNGQELETFTVGTDHMDFELVEYDGGPIGDPYMSDNFYTLKVLNDTLVGSNMVEWTHLSPEDHQKRGFLLIEDIKNQKSYSTEIYIFQRLVGGDAHHLYFIMNHPTKEDLVLVTLEYALPE